jgi:hypothetical protein
VLDDVGGTRLHATRLDALVTERRDKSPSRVWVTTVLVVLDGATERTQWHIPLRLAGHDASQAPFAAMAIHEESPFDLRLLRFRLGRRRPGPEGRPDNSHACNLNKVSPRTCGFQCLTLLGRSVREENNASMFEFSELANQFASGGNTDFLCLVSGKST